MASKSSRTFARIRSPSVPLPIPAFHRRPFPSSRGPIILPRASPRSTKAMRPTHPLIANRPRGVRISTPPKAILLLLRSRSASHRRRRVHQTAAVFAHHHSKAPPAHHHIPISPPYLHHSHIRPYPLQGVAQVLIADTRLRVPRPSSNSMGAPRRNRLGQDQADLGVAHWHRAPRVDRALHPLVVVHPRRRPRLRLPVSMIRR